MEEEKREGFSPDGPEIIEKRSRAPLIIAICAVALLAAVTAVYVLGLFGGGGGEEPEAKWMPAAWTEERPISRRSTAQP